MSNISDGVIEPYIAFSDSVIREHGTGKLSLIGTFERWHCPSFPFRAPPFVVTARLTNLLGKLTNVRVTFRVEESGNGHVVASVGAEVNATKDMERDDTIEIPIKMPPIQYQHPGTYEVVILLNNEPLGKRVFKVHAITQGQPPTDIKEDS